MDSFLVTSLGGKGAVKSADKLSGFLGSFFGQESGPCSQKFSKMLFYFSSPKEKS